jgi:hypothetical protein
MEADPKENIWRAEENLKTEAQYLSHFTSSGLLPISSSWRQALWDSRSVIFFQLNACSYSPYVTSSVTKRCVCLLQFLLILAGAFILMSQSCETHDHILLSQIKTPLTWWARSPYLHPQGRGWPSYTPRHWVPFSSPPKLTRTAQKHRSSFAECWLVIAETCLPRRCVTTAARRTTENSFQNFLCCCVLIRCRGYLFVLRSLPSNGSTRYNIMWLCMKYEKVMRRCEASAVDFSIDFEKGISPVHSGDYCHCWTIVGPLLDHCWFIRCLEHCNGNV